MQQLYTDKEILGDALATEKASTNNYNTFANECVHDNVRNTILKVLDQEHNIQQDVFQIMHEKGFYPTPDAQASKVEETKQKYASCAKTI
ncbi:MAG: spore coat protein [Lachnospiraceae bacterium]